MLTRLYKYTYSDPEWPKTSLYEGLIPRIERSFLKKEDGEATKYKKEIVKIVGKETCPTCGGTRLNPTVLQYKINNRNIADCVEMQITDLLDFIQTIYEPKAATMVKAIAHRLEHLVSIGLGYLTLNRENSTLSGGELQRVKLASELESHGNIYVLDEPTTGLHMSDIAQLLKIFNRLVDQGCTVIVIEHNLDVISQADWIIDLGPFAGGNDGNIMFQRTPKDLINSSSSITGQYLKEYIK